LHSDIQVTQWIIDLAKLLASDDASDRNAHLQPPRAPSFDGYADQLK
jgi:hypothetical protein